MKKAIYFRLTDKDAALFTRVGSAGIERAAKSLRASTRIPSDEDAPLHHHHAVVDAEVALAIQACAVRNGITKTAVVKALIRRAAKVRA